MKCRTLHLRLFFVLPLLLLAVYSQAQVMWGCNDPDGGIQIWFDYNQNCPNSPGSLAGLEEIGFHSGANGWASIVTWDAANATTGVNIGNDTFVVSLPNPNTYYGTTVTALNFVFNQGTINPTDPWGSEGKENDRNGGCFDFYLDLLTISQTCPALTGVQELVLDKHLTIAPNPFSDYAVITFENDAQENYTIQIRNSLGQVVKEVAQFNGNQLVFNKVDHAPGFYVITLINSSGQFFSSQMLIQ